MTDNDKITIEIMTLNLFTTLVIMHCKKDKITEFYIVNR